MDPISRLEKMIWILFAATALINLMILRKTARGALSRQPELKEGYRKLLLGRLVVPYLPLAMMLLGFSLGYVPSMLSYFRPQHGNPYVLAWYVLWLVLITAGVRWMFWGDGAPFLVRHRELWGPWKRRIPTTPKGVKLRFLRWISAVPAGVLVVAFVFGTWTDHPIHAVDQLMLARLTFSNAPAQLRPGDSARHQIGIRKGDGIAPLRAPVSWSVRPDNQGATIDPRSGLLTIDPAVSAGMGFEITARVEGGLWVLTTRLETVREAPAVSDLSRRDCANQPGVPRRF
jgi:hypothetical protein